MVNQTLCRNAVLCIINVDINDPGVDVRITYLVAIINYATT